MHNFKLSFAKSSSICVSVKLSSKLSAEGFSSKSCLTLNAIYIYIL